MTPIIGNSLAGATPGERTQPLGAKNQQGFMVELGLTVILGGILIALILNLALGQKAQAEARQKVERLTSAIQHAQMVGVSADRAADRAWLAYDFAELAGLGQVAPPTRCQAKCPDAGSCRTNQLGPGVAGFAAFTPADNTGHLCRTTTPFPATGCLQGGLQVLVHASNFADIDTGEELCRLARQSGFAGVCHTRNANDARTVLCPQ